MTATTGATPFHNGVGFKGATKLELWGHLVSLCFDGEVPYHVGSSTVSKQWNDVDVRLILDEDKFNAMFPGFERDKWSDPKWEMTCLAFTEWGCVFTGLPIDFQIQPMTLANSSHCRSEHPTVRTYRNALGISYRLTSKGGGE